eukprot:Rhum_TRINITY_DN11784_c0_g2::Rhum_TRINITY_DN11784_c0_g2_i1::g.46920::m.46920
MHMAQRHHASHAHADDGEMTAYTCEEDPFDYSTSGGEAQYEDTPPPKQRVTPPSRRRSGGGGGGGGRAGGAGKGPPRVSTNSASSPGPSSPCPASPRMPLKEKGPSKRPTNSALQQQRLSAWQPTYGFKSSMACLCLVAAAAIPLGVMMFVAGAEVVEVRHRYDNLSGLQGCSWVKDHPDCLVDNCAAGEPCADQGTCGMVSRLPEHCPRQFRREDAAAWSDEKVRALGDCDPHCFASLDFTLTETLRGPVFLYYELTKFYQNHRTFVESRSESQIAGDKPQYLSFCKPILHPGSRGVDAFCAQNARPTVSTCEDLPVRVGEKVHKIGDLTYAPCGLPAWSMFNDSFALSQFDDNATAAASTRTLVCDGEVLNERPPYHSPLQTPVNEGFGYGNATNLCRKEGISWKVDREKKFSDPQSTDTLFDTRGLHNNSFLTPHAFIAPYLLYGWYMFEPYHRLPYQKDEDFMVWSRVAMLPTFRKLYRAIDGDLAPGRYRMEIKHRFDVRPFGGEKAFVLATTSWTGGDMTFVAVLLLTLGIISFVACIVFSALNIVNFRERRDALEEWKLESQRRIPLYNGQVQELEEDIEA